MGTSEELAPAGLSASPISSQGPPTKPGKSPGCCHGQTQLWAFCGAPGPHWHMASTAPALALGGGPCCLPQAS